MGLAGSVPVDRAVMIWETHASGPEGRREKVAKEFQQFDQSLFDFLMELELNNRRDWFNPNKQRYEKLVRGPALAFIRTIGARLATAAPHLVADDRKSGGSLMRVYRDTRFSKDKTPYKTNVGVHFRHDAGKDVHAPGLYVHMEADSGFLGCGMWRPDSKSLAAIRQKIDEEGERWLSIVRSAKLTRLWKQAGESLVRPPKGYDKDNPLIEELKRKDHILGADLTLDQLTSAELPDLVMTHLEAARPHMVFLCEAIGQPF